MSRLSKGKCSLDFHVHLWSNSGFCSNFLNYTCNSIQRQRTWKIKWHHQLKGHWKATSKLGSVLLPWSPLGIYLAVKDALIVERWPIEKRVSSHAISWRLAGLNRSEEWVSAFHWLPFPAVRVALASCDLWERTSHFTLAQAEKVFKKLRTLYIPGVGLSCR